MFSFFGLGKDRSKFGKWLDRRGISQKWVEDNAKVSKGTVSRLCSESDAKPNGSTANKILKALKKVGHSVDYDDFWM
ncbi:helix-turn-helix domain-containing protein [Bacillus marasmi]|uniref:helix-turn-helix domain-containing protein n=1 Tax=Bacillus marasmi TaxID=1926279 RepID=UPI0011C98445|nr:helix-turn-helix transcriptional regulator [Bacillus marasmi]